MYAYHGDSMNNTHLVSVSAHTARKLTFKQIESWSAAGASHRDELKIIVKEITRSLYRNKSPAKTLSAAIKKLNGLFSKREIRGEVNIHNNRHINFRLAFPTNTEDKLIFCLLYGEINARTGAVKFDLTTPIQMSLHALQRLFERLEQSSEDSLLDEIYSCMGQALHWHKGATEIDAKCWPLISKNGLFIATSQPGSLTTNVITWLQETGISKKWGIPLSNLSRLKADHPKRLEDFKFAQEFIRSFPWMLYEHVPSEDFTSLALDQQDEEEKPENFSSDLYTNNQSNEKINSPNLDRKKISASYIAGLNYKKSPPPFKTHTLHCGVVVQQGESGNFIVGLTNGWVGQIPSRSIERGHELIINYKKPQIGDEIFVLVHKITHFPEEDAYALSLDPKDISDVNWESIEKEYLIGSIQAATLEKKYHQEFMAKLDSGIRGVIPAEEVETYLKQPSTYGCSPVGLKLDVVVIGYRAEKKCLLLSINNLNSLTYVESDCDLFKTGDRVFGKCIRNASNYSLIELPKGVTGLLHKLNNWGKELPAVGDEVELIFIEGGKTQLLLGGIPENNLQKTFFAHPFSKEKWDHFIDLQSVGDSLEVQILFWREKTMCFMVVTSSGVSGIMPSTEINWLNQSPEELKHLLKPGDIFNAEIIKIYPDKNRVIFSKKALEKNPIDDVLENIQLNDSFVGTIVNVLEYGCFLKLENLGAQVLLHRTKIPDGKSFSKGEVCTVYIDSIDFEKKRISVKLTSL